MRFHDLGVVLTAAAMLLPAAAGAQDSAQMAAQQAQLRAMIEQIARDRPPQAEIAARELMARLQIARASLDSLLARSPAEYWAEVAQLTVQREMLTHQLDATRAQLMTQLFETEARARALQREYRRMPQGVADGGRSPILVVDGEPLATADSGRVRAIRERLQELMLRHFAAEDSLRALEMADVERRLAQVRAETERRRRERTELVRQQVEQILRDAVRPQ